jgi:hypothetical protein
MPWTELLQTASMGSEQRAVELANTRPELIFVFDENGRSALHFAARKRLFSLIDVVQRVLRARLGSERAFWALWSMSACFAANP